MDWGVVLGVITGVLLVSYLAIVAWAWSRRRRREFDEASRYPFFEEVDRL